MSNIYTQNKNSHNQNESAKQKKEQKEHKNKDESNVSLKKTHASTYILLQLLQLLYWISNQQKQNAREMRTH